MTAELVQIRVGASAGSHLHHFKVTLHAGPSLLTQVLMRMPPARGYAASGRSGLGSLDRGII
jgi:hypothetical protein